MPALLMIDRATRSRLKGIGRERSKYKFERRAYAHRCPSGYAKNARFFNLLRDPFAAEARAGCLHRSLACYILCSYSFGVLLPAKSGARYWLLRLTMKVRLCCDMRKD